MKSTGSRLLRFLGLFFLVISACNLSSQGAPTPGSTLPTAQFSPGVTGQPSQSPASTATLPFPGGETEAPLPQTGETQAAPVDTPVPEVPHVVAVQDINVRDGPGTYYLIVGRLAQNERAAVTGQATPFGARWWKIECPSGAQGNNCWVSSGEEFTRAVNADGVPQAEVPPTPVRREDVPPEGVAAQLGNFIPGISCQGTLTAGADEQFRQVEVLERFPVCLEGFAPNENVRIRVFLPNGDVLDEQNVQSPEVGEPVYVLRILPGQPLGEYKIRARQGDLVANGSFTLAAASQETVYVTPEAGEQGSAFQVALAGFDSPPDLYLYRLTDSQDGFPYKFISYLATPRLDGRGEAVFSFRVAPDDPPGEYVVSEPIGKARARFRITD
jgi:hypothetical protein